MNLVATQLVPMTPTQQVGKAILCCVQQTRHLVIYLLVCALSKPSPKGASLTTPGAMPTGYTGTCEGC